MTFLYHLRPYSGCGAAEAATGGGGGQAGGLWGGRAGAVGWNMSLPTSSPNLRGKYIAVAGPIGVGKSVFARMIANRLGAEYVPELFQENKFLERLYEPGGIERWGLACELDFLPARYEQACMIREMIERGQTVVTDWVLDQNLIFSRITLTPDDFDAYRVVFDRLRRSAPTPDRLVCLDARLPVLLERIRGRGRDMEQSIDPGYVGRLRQGYLRWSQEPPAPAVWLDTSELPIPHSEAARAQALGVVWDALGFCPLREPMRSALSPVRSIA